MKTALSINPQHVERRVGELNLFFSVFGIFCICYIYWILHSYWVCGYKYLEIGNIVVVIVVQLSI